MSGPSITSILRNADWLDAPRASAYARILFWVQLGALAALVATSHGGLDARGEPLGTDFVSFWTAARMALGGAPASVYDPAAHLAAEQAEFGAHLGWYAFFYPPIFLLYCLPLALAPYFVALFLWLTSTLAAYVLVVRRLAARSLGLLPILAFPAVLSTIGHGQNAFLSTALFGGGVLLLGARPFMAGLCFGALAYKPQLALLAPLGLLAMGRWRALAGMGVAVLFLAGLSLALFGPETWSGFFKASAIARAALEQGGVEPEKMQSLYAAIRLFGGSAALASGAQLALSLGVATVLVALLRRDSKNLNSDPLLQGGLLAVAALLVTPFVLDYDLTLLAIPLSLFFSRARVTGFLPYEKTILLAAFTLPAVSRALAQHAHLPLAPMVLLLLFAAIARRMVAEAKETS